MSSIPRGEYPRPQFRRENWISLNGTWDFSFDTDTFDGSILVPYVYQSPLSGIGTRDFHETVWYLRRFSLPDSMLGQRILLHFGAVDYCCRVWLNGQWQGEHKGGHTGFSFDITDALTAETEHEIRVEVQDPPFDLEFPRGKQYWKEQSSSIFYTPSTGIWQSVWLEAVPEHYIRHMHITPLLDEHAVAFEYELSTAEGSLTAEIYFGDTFVTAVELRPQSCWGRFAVSLDQPALQAWNFLEDLTWSPEEPRLFDVRFCLIGPNGTQDCVASYFGMRKVGVQNGRFMLNNRPYYQKLVLDQGYWPESLLTAPSDAAFVRDIELTKQMGFNGVRKHQKVEDPRYLYHADRLGLLVWGEMASAYVFSRGSVLQMMAEWSEAVLQGYNHPCIVVWTPLNESWGVPSIAASEREQQHCRALYHHTKSLDGTRLVIDNDGWEHLETDLLTIHDYEWDGRVLKKRYESIESIQGFMPSGHAMYVGEASYAGEPVLVTECGGISCDPGRSGQAEDWGYSKAKDAEDLLRCYRDVVEPLLQSEAVQGFCYTQLTDVEQEVNGLLTYGRQPKVAPELIRAVNGGETVVP